jgi:hypothetical protein
MEELLAAFTGFHQIIFNFSIAHSPHQFFSQLTAHNSFFHSHSPTKQTLTHVYRRMSMQVEKKVDKASVQELR